MNSQAKEKRPLDTPVPEITLLKFCNQEPYCLESLIDPLHAPQPQEEVEIYISLIRLFEEGLTDVAYLVARAMGRFGVGRTIFDEIFFETLEDRWGDDAQERFVAEFIRKYRNSASVPNEPKYADGFIKEVVANGDNPTPPDSDVP
jgi:hypothetical protein